MISSRASLPFSTCSLSDCFT